MTCRFPRASPDCSASSIRSCSPRWLSLRAASSPPTVSRAGGFGIIGGGYGEEPWLTGELDAAGDARVGVGFITWSMAKNPRLLDLALERKPAAIMLSFGDVKPHVDKIKRAGALMICQVQTVEQAKDAAANGADVFVAQGAEGRRAWRRARHVRAGAGGGRCGARHSGRGGRRGRGRARACGCADARRRRRPGRHALLCDTRGDGRHDSAARSASLPEAATTPRAGSCSTSCGSNVWPAPYSVRVLRNEFFDRWRGREAELMQHHPEEAARYDKAREAGDFDTAAVIAGEGVDMISDIPPAQGSGRPHGQGSLRAARRLESLSRGLIISPRAPP